MSGSGKDTSGVVGSSQNEVRAGTFPDTKRYQFFLSTHQLVVSDPQALSHIQVKNV